jgi:hypothetical protein
MSVAVVTFPCRLKKQTAAISAQIDAEMAWRAICCEFLGACFRGHDPDRIKTLGRAVFMARDRMERGTVEGKPK